MLSSWPEAQQSWKTNPFLISDKGWLLIWKRRKKKNLHTWNWSRSTNKGKHRCAALNSVFKFLRYLQGGRIKDWGEHQEKPCSAPYLPRESLRCHPEQSLGRLRNKGQVPAGSPPPGCLLPAQAASLASVSSRSAGKILASSPLRVQW